MTADDRQRLRERRDALARQSVAYVGNRDRSGRVKRVGRLGADLTARETQVLLGAMAGLTYPQTALWIGISEATVKQYSGCLLGKLGANTIAHAVAVVCLDSGERFEQIVAQARELRRSRLEVAS